MAFNYRPKSTDDIKSMNFSKEKEQSLIGLFESLKKKFPQSEEFVTVDIKAQKAKILRMFQKDLNLKEIKNNYPGLALDFGDGTSPESDSPSTKQQELVTLAIFEELLSSKTKRYSKFEELLPLILIFKLQELKLITSVELKSTFEKL